MEKYWNKENRLFELINIKYKNKKMLIIFYRYIKLHQLLTLLYEFGMYLNFLCFIPLCSDYYILKTIVQNFYCIQKLKLQYNTLCISFCIINFYFNSMCLSYDRLKLDMLSRRLIT